MTICYLCGTPIEGEVSRDHVPPGQFFPRGIRRKHNLDRLVTLPAHPLCNAGFQKDEEYFLWSLGPLAAGSYSGSHVVLDLGDRFRAGKFLGLGNASLNEFDARPGGLYLPGDKVVKRVQGDRVRRVAWKIVRGLHFHEYGAVLRDSTPFFFELFEPEHEFASEFLPLYEQVKASPSRGAYPAIFDYKYLVHDRVGTSHVWGMLFWDQLMVFLLHHGPTCSCVKCAPADDGQPSG
jgi:hypothetical protein